MAVVIALCNQKGGVGKTTSTVNIGAGLAELSQRVLMVDLDPQAALTAYWGLHEPPPQPTLYQLLSDGRTPVHSALRTVRPAIDVIPSDIDLAAAEIELFSALGRERILKEVLEPIDEGYDYVLIDCPPNLGLLTINALVTAQGVIVPLQCEYFALRGLAMLLDTLHKVKRRLNPQLAIIGILPTLYNTRTRHAKEVLEEVRTMFGERVFDTVVRTSIRFAESTVAHQPILEYAPSHPGAQAYRSLAKEILDDTTTR
ncbi:MAG: ParA family protein [Caldilineales bacterium]